MNEKNSEQKKKKRGKKSKAAVGTGIGAVILALIAASLRLGIGAGGDFDAILKSPVPREEQTIEVSSGKASESPEIEKETELIIEVKEDELVFDGQTMEIDELRESILNKHEDGRVWELRDSQAIKATYDQAKALLEEMSISFIES